MISSLVISGGTATLQFTGTDGQSYSLNKATDMSFSSSNIVDSVALSGSTNGVLQDASVSENEAFYRVEQ